MLNEWTALVQVSVGIHVENNFSIAANKTLSVCKFPLANIIPIPVHHFGEKNLRIASNPAIDKMVSGVCALPINHHRAWCTAAIGAQHPPLPLTGPSVSIVSPSQWDLSILIHKQSKHQICNFCAPNGNKKYKIQTKTSKYKSMFVHLGIKELSNALRNTHS